MIITLFLLTLKLIVSQCTCCSLASDDSLREAIFVLFREVVIVACGAIIVTALNFCGILKINKTQAIGATYCILLSIVLWVVLGSIMMVCAQR